MKQDSQRDGGYIQPHAPNPYDRMPPQEKPKPSGPKPELDQDAEHSGEQRGSVIIDRTGKVIDDDDRFTDDRIKQWD